MKQCVWWQSVYVYIYRTCHASRVIVTYVVSPLMSYLQECLRDQWPAPARRLPLRHPEGTAFCFLQRQKQLWLCNCICIWLEFVSITTTKKQRVRGRGSLSSRWHTFLLRVLIGSMESLCPLWFIRVISLGFTMEFTTNRLKPKLEQTTPNLQLHIKRQRLCT